MIADFTSSVQLMHANDATAHLTTDLREILTRRSVFTNPDKTDSSCLKYVQTRQMRKKMADNSI